MWRPDPGTMRSRPIASSSAFGTWPTPKGWPRKRKALQSTALERRPCGLGVRAERRRRVLRADREGAAPAWHGWARQAAEPAFAALLGVLFYSQRGRPGRGRGYGRG